VVDVLVGALDGAVEAAAQGPTKVGVGEVRLEER